MQKSIFNERASVSPYYKDIIPNETMNRKAVYYILRVLYYQLIKSPN